MSLQNVVTFLFALWVAYNHGSELGHKLFWVPWNDAFGAAFYGGTTAFMGAWIFGLLVLWPIVRAIGNALFGELGNLQLWGRRKASANPVLTEPELEARLAAGMLFRYEGLVNRDYSYRNGRAVKVRVRVRFSAQRNTLAMSPRGRQAVRIFETLRAEDLLGGAADRLRFALAWNDGRCQFEGGKVTADKRLFTENGWRSFHDIVAAEASHRLAYAEGAVNELFSMLQAAALHPKASPRIARLMKRYTKATQVQAESVNLWS